MTATRRPRTGPVHPVVRTVRDPLIGTYLLPISAVIVVSLIPVALELLPSRAHSR
ncbi:MAG: hypothetical protein JWR70_3245 [Modestobacter sp.]|nr:hypothetical protein [Modestobacter sp.]